MLIAQRDGYGIITQSAGTIYLLSCLNKLLIFVPCCWSLLCWGGSKMIQTSLQQQYHQNQECIKHRLAYDFNFSWNNYFKSFPFLFSVLDVRFPSVTDHTWSQLKFKNLQLIDEETAAHNDDSYYSAALFIAAAYRTCHCEKTRGDRLTIKKSQGDLLCFREHSRWMECTLGNILLWKTTHADLKWTWK